MSEIDKDMRVSATDLKNLAGMGFSITSVDGSKPPVSQPSVPQQVVKPVEQKAPPSNNKKASEKKSKSSSREKKSHIDVPDVSMSVVRNIPTCLLQYIRQKYPKADNNTDALIAFLCSRMPEVQSDREVRAGLTSVQQDLIDDEQDSEYSVLSDRVRRMIAKQDKMAKELELVEFLTEMSLIDRLATFAEDVKNVYGSDSAAIARVLGLSPLGVDARPDIILKGGHIEVLKKTFEAYRKQKDYRDGKPTDF